MSTHKTPQSRPSILEIAPYIPGSSQTKGVKTLYKLSANETPFGASSKAIEAYQKEAQNLSDYPDGSAYLLRKAIAKHHTLNIDQIICGAGSDEILNLIAQAYLQKDDEAIYTRHGFLVYPIATKAAGGKPIIAEEKDLTTDIDAILEKISSKTRIIFIANPNNPTGTYIHAEKLKTLHSKIRSDILLVIDGAYAEYVQENDYKDGRELVEIADNVIITRTFSKAYGLAGLRIGWAYSNSTVIDILNRIRGPFNLTSPAIAAGCAAMADKEHLDKTIKHNQKALPQMTKALEALGLTVTPSVANFILVHFDSTIKTAKEADHYLRQQGIIVRAMHAYGIPNALRITIGSNEANEALIKALAAFIATS